MFDSQETNRLRDLVSNGAVLDKSTVLDMLTELEARGNKIKSLERSNYWVLPAKLAVLAFDAGEFNVRELPEGKIFAGFLVDSGNRWSAADETSIHILPSNWR